MLSLWVSNFQSFSKSEIKKKILNVDNPKAYQKSDIPTKVINANSDILSGISYEIFNRSLEVG